MTMRAAMVLRSITFVVWLWPAAAAAQGTAVQTGAAVDVGSAALTDATVPPLAPLTAIETSTMATVVQRFNADRGALQRRYDVAYSPVRRERLGAFYSGWRERLRELDFTALGREGQVDYLLLDNRLRYELEVLDLEERQYREMEGLIGFAPIIARLQEQRRDEHRVDPYEAASAVDSLVRDIRARHAELETLLRQRQRGDDGALPYSRNVGLRAADGLRRLQGTLDDWYEFFGGYDPLFTWWVTTPHAQAETALNDYGRLIREQVVGLRRGEPEPIIGDPIGEDGMRADLALEMIPYSPQELIRIAERELAWGENEMRRAARDMGFGDDWHAALEEVKTRYVEPGQQRALVLELAREAEDFLEARGLVTVEPLAKEVWRMNMLSPEAQRTAPFFLGGEVVRVAFPADEMDHADKLMSMRGNNIHFSRAVVHHELIPGHHLQGFMTSRYNTHRSIFSTPFWGEGWALYWEMLLWDEGFARSPEDRIGMLLWRNHRAARIIFSLSFHLGTMTPEEAIELLVNRVGHERANAEAEVRRSFGGRYSPLYQVAYMIGGLQFRALHQELVQSGRMSNAEFHDRILQSGRMPVEMVRALLTDVPLDRDYRPRWRFYGDPMAVRE